VAWAIVALADPIGIPAMQSELDRKNRLPRPPEPVHDRFGSQPGAVDLLKKSIG
jgi:hypothetical protein